MDFWNQYFLKPIETGSGYNIVNTIAYALILIVSLFVLVKALKRLKIKLDNKLWSDLLPFVVLGGVLRALEDVSFFPHTWLLITPGIYFLVFALAFGSMLVEKYSRLPFTRYFGISLLALAGIVTVLYAENWDALLAIMGLALVVFLAVYALLRVFRIKLLRKENAQVFFSHMLDASASFVAVTYLCVGTARYFEQHVVPSFLFGAIGTWVFIPLKIIIVLLALWVIDRETDKEWNWMLKFTVLVLGLAPGTRDLLTAFMNSIFC